MEGNATSIVDRRPQAATATSGHDVAHIVTTQERLKSIAPRLAYPVAFVALGLPMLPSWSPPAISLLAAKLVTFVSGKLLKRLAVTPLINFSRRMRYHHAAATLRNRIAEHDDLIVGPLSWTYGSPGVLAVTRAGDLLLLSRDAGYQLLRLHPREIADVRVTCTSQHVTQTHNPGRALMGGLGGSFAAGFMLGSRSMSVTSTINEYLLEIRYQLERNGPVGTIFVPGGNDRRVVEELCVTISRLEAPASQDSHLAASG